MYRKGHMGATLGITSLGSVLWVRKRVADRLDHLSQMPVRERPSVTARIARRAPYILAAATVTGTATLVSGTLDAVEKRLFGFGNHRGELHSLPKSAGSTYMMNKILRKAPEYSRRLCRKFDINNQNIIERTVAATRDLTQYLLNGAFAGQVTHVLGDLPTLGRGGSALQMFAPITNRGMNLNLIAASSPLLNTVCWKSGLTLCAASCSALIVYATTPTWPKAVLAKKIRRLSGEMPDDLVDDIATRITAMPEKVEFTLAEVQK